MMASHAETVVEKNPLADNEWMQKSALDKVSENDEAIKVAKDVDDEKQPEDSEDDAAIITKFDRKNRNRTKWYDRKPAAEEKEGFALEDIIDQAIKKNKA
jgi:hypothetical protein